ncbi:MAG: 4Fe-4S binding protein [Candidatus Hodarchaeales archaeon]
MSEDEMKDPVLPLGRPTEESAGETGTWRTAGYPVIDLENCNKCHTCVISCPEVAITLNEEEFPEINLRTCKGCGICAEVCPKHCIEMINE